MKNCYLYIRVSTDEQADKGYSQRAQEERLKHYCEINYLNILGVYFEDYSAKTFNRPAFSQLLADLKKKKGKIDFLIFTKWDRFSRNATDAYAMIRGLRKRGVEPQAVEQPLNLKVPENKMMLAFYLASPEVENDRRSLNVTCGMRRANKEGRWMGGAPIGYVNKITETGKKYIEPNPKTSPVVEWIFNKLAENKYSSESIWKEARQKGLKCSKNNFHHLIRNPVYYGRIKLKQFEDEKEMLVLGNHQPIITKELFDAVQDALDKRKRKQKTKVRVQDRFPLRGFLVCPRCSKLLTASSSTGRHSKYDYYHCNSVCGFRYKAPAANNLLNEQLNRWEINKIILQLYKDVLYEFFHDNLKNKQAEIRRAELQLLKLSEAESQAVDLLVHGHLEPGDFKKLKLRNAEEVDLIKHKLNGLKRYPADLRPLVNKAVSMFCFIPAMYNEIDINLKREMLGLMFPGKIHFADEGFAKNSLNEMVITIFNSEAAFVNLKEEIQQTIADLKAELIKMLKSQNQLKYTEEIYLHGANWFLNSSALTA